MRAEAVSGGGSAGVAVPQLSISSCKVSTDTVCCVMYIRRSGNNGGVMMVYSYLFNVIISSLKIFTVPTSFYIK